MPTPITQYYLNRESPYTMQVNIFDPTPYAAYQLYCDNILQVGRSTKTFIGQISPNQKVDILGCAANEINTDWSATLDDDNGDKVVFYLDADTLGDQLYIFWDNGTGTIDYSVPLEIIDTSDLVANSPSYDDFLTWSTDSFIWMTTAHFIIFMTYDEYGSVRLVITKRIKTGNYLFGFQTWTLGGSSPTFEDEAFVVTRPDELMPTIASYNPTTDTLVINSNSTDTDPIFAVYATTLNGGYSSLGTSQIVTTTDPTITVTGLRNGNANASGTIYLLVREAQNGLQEQNWNWITFTLVNGNWVSNIPGSPTNLKATLTQGNLVQLSWSYTDPRKPDGFHIYYSTTAINYATPYMTINGANSTVYRYDVTVITEPADFAVRAFIGSTTDQNTVVVSEAPYPVPTEVPYGDLNTTWKDI